MGKGAELELLLLQFWWSSTCFTRIYFTTADYVLRANLHFFTINTAALGTLFVEFTTNKDLSVKSVCTVMYSTRATVLSETLQYVLLTLIHVMMDVWV